MDSCSKYSIAAALRAAEDGSGGPSAAEQVESAAPYAHELPLMPVLKFDLKTGSNIAFGQLIEEFYKAAKKLPLKPLGLKDGWYQVTPEIAYEWLLHNRGNRPVSRASVEYYGNQMLADSWVKTGQPIIFDTDDVLDDGQHRLIAGVLNNVTFWTYVVIVEPHPTMFAFLDNGKVRNAADGLKTAGQNGVSPKLAATIEVLDAYLSGAYVTGGKKLKVARLAPVQFINYANSNENIRHAVRLMAGDHREAAKLIRHPGVAGFVAFMILNSYGESELDAFMEDLGDAEADLGADNPITLLRRALEKDAKADDPMTKPQVLANIIKAFNAYVAKVPMRRLVFGVNEEFPQFAVSLDADDAGGDDDAIGPAVPGDDAGEAANV